MALTELSQANSPRPRKKTYWRAGILIAVHIAAAIHIAHWRATGETISPVEPSEAMQTLEGGLVNAGFIFFALSILSTLIFGRFFCGWGCHLVAIQDACGSLMQRYGIRPKPFRSRVLVYVPVFAGLYMFVWPSVQRILLREKAPEWVYHLYTEKFWATFPGPGIAILTFVVCGGLVVYFLGNKGYCTYACPYGFFFYHADRIAPGKIRVTDACDQCGQCTAHCTSNVRVHEEVHLLKMVQDPGCMKCLDCIDVCPKGALYYGLGKPLAPKELRAKPRPAKKYDLTIPEEILLAGSFVVCLYAFRGLYEQIPFLLALGMSSISAFLFLTAWQVIRGQNGRLARWTLKRSGKWTPAGKGILATIGLWGAFTVHSAVVNYYVHQANAHLAYAQAYYDGKAKITGAEADGLARLAREDLQTALKIGLFPVALHHAKLGSIALFLQETEVAERELLVAVGIDPNGVGAVTQLARTYSSAGKWSAAAIMARRWLSHEPNNIQALMILGSSSQRSGGEAEEIISAFETVIKLEPDNVDAHINLGMQLAGMSRLSEGQIQLERAVALRPANAQIRHNLALILAEQGRLREALEAEKKAVELDPELPGAKLVLAKLAFRLGDVRLFEELADSIRDENPFDAESVILWASAKYKSGELAEILRLTPVDAKDFYARAALFARMGRAVEANEAFSFAKQKAGRILEKPWYEEKTP